MTEAQMRRPRRRPGENRERLVAAGILEFGTQGYHGAGTAAIAASADVPQPHVYASFEAKRDLFFACAERVSTELLEPSASSSVAHARFIYQAVAAARDPELTEVLLPLLTQTRHELGEPGFSKLIADGARALLSEDAERSQVDAH